MSPAQYNEFRWTMRIAPYYLTAGLAALIISLFWEPLHPACLVTAFGVGILSAYLKVLDRAGAGWFRTMGSFAMVFSVPILVNHYHGGAVCFQYFGSLISAFVTGFWFYGRRFLNKNDPPAAAKPAGSQI